MSHLAAVVSRSPETEAVSPRTLNLNPFKPSGEAVIGHEYFVFSLLLGFIGHFCLWEPRGGEWQVWSVATEFFFHYALICFEFLPKLPAWRVCTKVRTRVSSTAENLMSTSALLLASFQVDRGSVRGGAATTLCDCPRMNSRAYCPLIDGAVSLSDSCPLWPTKNSSQSTDRLPSFSSFPLIDLID